MAKDYAKKPDRTFALTMDVTVPAGTVFARAPLERGDRERLEGIVALGKDVTAYLNLPLRVVEIDAKEWFEEVSDEHRQTAEPGERHSGEVEGAS